MVKIHKVMAIKKQLKYLEKELQGLEGDSVSFDKKSLNKRLHSPICRVGSKKEANRGLKKE